MSHFAAMGKRKPIPILLGANNGDHILIEPSPHMAEGWYTADIALRCGTWAGHCRAQFAHGELSKFGRSLEELYRGERFAASFKAAEQHLTLALMNDGKDGKGLLRVTGAITPNEEPKVRIEFEFKVEPGRLSETIRGLQLADREV